MNTKPTLFSHRVTYRFHFNPTRTEKTVMASLNQEETVESARRWLGNRTGASFDIVSVRRIGVAK